MILFDYLLSLEYREAFQLFDTVGDGKIECSESGDVIRSLDFNPASEDIKKVVTDVDPKGELSTMFAKCCMLLYYSCFISGINESLRHDRTKYSKCWALTTEYKCLIV